MTRIAFIGLGVMGAPMARNLIKAGYDISLCDNSPNVIDKFAEDGLSVSPCPANAARDADIVFSILPRSDVIEQILLGANGAINAVSPGALFVEMSTGSFQAYSKLRTSLSDAGMRVMDAPVGRSKREAEKGQSLIMVGGDESDLEQVKPYFQAMASNIVHAGNHGRGLQIKLINNYMAMVNHVLTGEVIAFAENIGLPTDVVVDVLSTTSAGRGQLLTNFPKKVLAGDISPDFPIDMAIKDLSVAIELFGPGENFGTLAKSIFEKASSAGFGQQDATCVLNYQRGLAQFSEEAQ